VPCIVLLRHGCSNMADEPERVCIAIIENLGISDREEIAFGLEHETGIASAYFSPKDPHVLVVNYEREHFSQLTLLDTIEQHRVHGEVIEC
jgi:hypothetical protein